MKKLGIVCGVLTALFMSGCNSSDGGNGSSQSRPEPITTSTSSNSFIGNGIYTDNEYRFMLVDSNRDQYNVLVGDPSNEGFYAIHHTVATENQMKAYSLTSSVEGYVSSDIYFTATASFTTDSVDIAGVSEGESIVYSMDKAANSLELADLAGTYSDEDGSEWAIKSDGSFVLSYVLNSNSGCTITGNLEPKDGIYYNIKDAEVTGCPVDGIYNGVMLTVDHSGTDVIFAAMYNDENFLSAALPLISK